MVLVDRLGYGADLDQALRIVDSFLMRRVAIKAYYSGFDDVAFGYVQAIRDAPEGGVCAALLEQFEKSTWANRWPDDEEVVLHLLDADMYSGISSARKQLLLRGIAQRMHEENPGLSMDFTPRELTVEHVVPQTWDHWKDDLNFEDTDEGRSRLNRLVHRIGNLTLVTGPMNSGLSNHKWSWKKNLLRGDNLEMNRRLIEDMEGDIWNEREIERRSKTLADYVNKIWPHAAALRRELGISAEGKATGLVSGISALVAERLVDSVTESGIEDGWADKEGLYRTRRGERYGRHLKLGGGDRWQVVWFGVSTRERQLVLDCDDAPDVFISVSDDIGEMIESVTTQVREVAESIADGGADG